MVESSGLYPDHDKSAGQPAEGPTQLHDGGQTQRMGASRCPASCGQPPCNRVEDVYVAGVAAGADRVRHDDGVFRCPGVERLAGVVELEDPDVEAFFGYPAGDLYAYGIVAAVGVAETDDECLRGQCSSIVRSRKCVAHEMQGS